MKNAVTVALVMVMVMVMVMVLVLTPLPAFALGRPPLTGGVSVEVVSDNGSAFLTVPHADQWQGATRITKQYLEARRNETYGIVVRNNGPERIGLVIAVDGRNIITGKRSDLRCAEQMYIVGPYETAQYEGWRTSSNEVHRFFFTNTEDSYSVRTFSDSSALGVIAVAVFREKERPQAFLERKHAENAPAAPFAGSAERSRKEPAAEDRAATGFGDGRYSPVVTVQFEPERTAVQKMLLKYEWREELCRKGIIRCGKDPANRLWEDEGYAPYPPDTLGRKDMRPW
jgi:hypothetical protein